MSTSNDRSAAQGRRWLTWRRWFGLIAAAFVVAYALGLAAWCYDEAAYGDQPWFQPFEFIGFGGLCAFVAWKWISRG